MKRTSDKWIFVPKSSRPALSQNEARVLRAELSKTLKIGIELEYNLNDNKQGCKGNDANCPCAVSFIPGAKTGIKCFEYCQKKGKCELETKHGCPDDPVFCISFESTCPSCDKFDRLCGKCSKKHNPTKDPNNIRESITKALSPTKFLGSLGTCGVLDVTKDGSLSGNGGVEIVTVGRRVNFYSIYEMTRRIVDVALKHEAFVNERCSTHFHLLSGYLSSGGTYNGDRPNYGLPALNKSPLLALKDGTWSLRDLENPVPEIVLANFHQLWRRFENAYIWITSTGDSYKRLTRWVKFRKPLQQFSALRSHMKTVIEEVSKTGEKGRYTSVNYTPTRFDEKGAVERLHFEIRAPDGLLSPAAISAFACMSYGLFMKAIDISKHGLLDSGTKEAMDRSWAIHQALCNNDGQYSSDRHSNTSELDVYIPELVDSAREMVRLVKNYLVNEPPAYDILMSLAETPISIRRSRGASWEDIEKELMPNPDIANNKIALDIGRAVDLNLVTECTSMAEWVQTVAEEFGCSKESVEKVTNELSESGAAFWNGSFGSFVRR